MRFITLKDTHFQFGFAHPRGRTEDFEDQIYNKINQVISYAQLNDIHHLILTGDSLNFSQSSAYTLDRVRKNLSIFKELSKQFIIYDIAGNHSLPFASKAHKEGSFHQLLIEQNLIKDLTIPVQVDNVTLAGIDYTDNINELRDKMLELDSKFENLILVIHEHLIPSEKEKIPFGKYLTYKQATEDLKNTKFIIAGHLHKGYKTKTISNNLNKQITIINQWNFTRLARDYYALNAEHTPEFTVIDTDSGSCQTIQLDVMHFDKAFIINELKKEEALNNDLCSFIQAIKNYNNTVDSDLNSIPEDIKSRVDYYLEMARSKIKEQA